MGILSKALKLQVLNSDCAVNWPTNSISKACSFYATDIVNIGTKTNVS